MPEWLRRAGHTGPFQHGGAIVWSVAEGGRGRRWREMLVHTGMRHSLLLEMDPDGWFSHLELSTSRGLLTLHPEADGTLHGNAVTGRGVEHIQIGPWESRSIVLLDWSLVCRMAALPGLKRQGIAPGVAVDVPALVIHADLSRTLEPVSVNRAAANHWQIGKDLGFFTDDEGLLKDGGAMSWPLEGPGRSTWPLEAPD